MKKEVACEKETGGHDVKEKESFVNCGNAFGNLNSYPIDPKTIELRSQVITKTALPKQTIIKENR